MAFLARLMGNGMKNDPFKGWTEVYDSKLVGPSMPNMSNFRLRKIIFPCFVCVVVFLCGGGKEERGGYGCVCRPTRGIFGPVVKRDQASIHLYGPK